MTQIDQGSLLALAIALLFAAHFARAARWAALFPRKPIRPRRSALLIGLGIGYAINALVPLRLGEIIRGVVAGRLTKVRLAEVMATIVAERIADLAVLSLIIAAAASYATDPGFARATAAIFATAAGAALGFALLLRASATVRRLMWDAAGIFNDRIRVGVVDLVWSTAEMLVGGTLLRWKFTIATVGMWGLYAAAYTTFSMAIDTRLMDVVATVLQQPLRALALDVDPGGTAANNALYAFVLIPVLLILLLDPLLRTGSLAGAGDRWRQLFNTGRSSHDSRSGRFVAPGGYANFLGAMFSGENRAISGFGMQAIDDCIVHGFYHGGSDALTALVETDERLIIRKFGSGVAAAKLKIQADWLQRHRASSLPLVEVVSERVGAAQYSYDMPHVASATNFYDFIHTSDGQANARALRKLIERIDDLHARTPGGSAPACSIERYLAEKVTQNAQTIVGFAREHLGGETYTINGSPHDLRDWACLADNVWLFRQIRNPMTASIHGDLTIENVIIADDHHDGFYIIDPNPENIFDTPMIDWAKMMQSLHLGYEALNRNAGLTVTGNALSLPDARSQAYAALHETLEAEIVARFGEDGLREVHFHELANYLRLTTYKIRQSPERGLAFFACTSLLLRRYQARFG